MILLLACSEYQVTEPPPEPPERPPEEALDDLGQPPDWSSCTPGLLGQYTNLPWPLPAEIEVDPVFVRTDPSLELGRGWWPVDEGLQADPALFFVRWTAWVRTDGDDGFDFLFAADDDATIWLDGVEVARVEGGTLDEPRELHAEARSGQLSLQIEFLQLDPEGDSGFRFRVTGGEVQICPPRFDEG